MPSSNKSIPEELIRLLGTMSNPFLSRERIKDLLNGFVPVSPDMFMYALRKHNIPIHWDDSYDLHPWLKAVKKAVNAYHQQRMMFGLQLKKEWLDISARLQDHNIAFMWVKGFLVQESFYPIGEHRFFNDLDMLVHPGQIAETIDILSGLGYEAIGHQPDGEKQHRKNVMLRQKGQPVILEVHYSLLSFFYSQWTWPRQETFLKDMVIPEGLTLTTFDTEHYLVYLALHGAVHRWHRLFWLRDMVMVLHVVEPERVYRAYQSMQKERTHRSLLLAIALAHDIFQLPVENYKALLNSQEKVLNKLKNYCFRAMQYRNIVTPFFRVQKLMYYRLLYPGYRLRFKILWHIVLRKLGV